MNRAGLFIRCSLAFTFAASVGYAQALPLPSLPPAPLPPFVWETVGVLPPADGTAPTAPAGSSDTPSSSPASKRSLATPAPHEAPAFDLTVRPPRSDAERESLRRSRSHEAWYGWQTLSVDGAATALLLVGAAVVTPKRPTLMPEPDRRPFAFEGAALGIYALVPSVVHFGHGNGWQGLASIGLRVACPVVGFAVAYFVGSMLRVGTYESLEAGAVGAAVGVAGGAAADAAVLGWQRWSTPDLRTAVLSLHGEF